MHVDPLLPFQERALDWLESGAHDKAWLALDQGLGKTRTILEERVNCATEVAIPAFLRKNWQRQCAMWAPDAKVQFVSAHSGYRPGMDFYIVSYADLEHLTPPLTVQRFVADESHWLGSKKARRTKAAMRRAKTSRLVRLMSGTPDPNRPIELWPMAYSIGMTRMNYSEWGHWFCDAKWKPWGMDFRGASRRDELRKLFGQWAFRLTQREAVQLPPKRRRLIVLNAKLDMRERHFAVGEIMRNPNPISFVGLSEVLHEHGKRKVPAAMEYILNVMHDVTPVLIGVKHKAVAAEIESRLKEEGYKVGLLTGDTHPDKRDEIVMEFRRGVLDALVGNSRSMGVGVDGLQEVCHYGIMVEADWSEAVNAQLEDRLNRMGQKHPVQWDYLVIDRSIDARVIELCMWKREFADEITGDALRQSIEDLV